MVMAMQFLWSIDFLIIIFYLCVILYVGINVGRNIENLKDFAVSKKNFSTPTIIATMFATGIGGGSTIGLAEKAFSMGWIFAIPMIANSIGDLFYSCIMIRSKLFEKNTAVSVGELVGDLYGKSARIITGALAICVSLGYVSAQISGIGYVFYYFFEIPFIWGLSLGYVIVITYTTFGGIRSVIFTDVIQFGIMIISIPLLFNIGASKIGGISNIVTSASIESFTPLGITELMILCVVYSLIGFEPSFVQRLLVVKDTKQAFKSSFVSALIGLPFYMLVIGIGLIAFTLDQSINPNFALPYLIDHILPIGLKGFLIVGLLATIMSTADSDLNMIGISAVNDLIIPLWHKKLSDRQEITLARMATFIFALVSIFIPLYFKSILDIVIFSANFWAPTVLVPLIMGILGKKISSKAFLICLFFGVSTMILYHYYTNNKYDAGIILGVIANLMTFTICLKLEQKKEVRLLKIKS